MKVLKGGIAASVRVWGFGLGCMLGAAIRQQEEEPETLSSSAEIKRLMTAPDRLATGPSLLTALKLSSAHVAQNLFDVRRPQPSWQASPRHGDISCGPKACRLMESESLRGC